MATAASLQIGHGVQSQVSARQAMPAAPGGRSGPATIVTGDGEETAGHRAVMIVTGRGAETTGHRAVMIVTGHGEETAGPRALMVVTGHGAETAARRAATIVYVAVIGRGATTVTATGAAPALAQGGAAMAAAAATPPGRVGLTIRPDDPAGRTTAGATATMRLAPAGLATSGCKFRTASRPTS
jgi:hypothetical protein